MSQQKEDNQESAPVDEEALLTWSSITLTFGDIEFIFAEFMSEVQLICFYEICFMVDIYQALSSEATCSMLISGTDLLEQAEVKCFVQGQWQLLSRLLRFLGQPGL